MRREIMLYGSELSHKRAVEAPPPKKNIFVVVRKVKELLIKVQ